MVPRRPSQTEIVFLSITCLEMGQLQCMRRDHCSGSPGDLDGHRSLIKQLYAHDDMPLRAVLMIANDEHGMNVSYGSNRAINVISPT